MTAPAAFRATYSDWRLIKGRKVVQIVLELPIEQADQAYAVLGGMPNPGAEIWCGIARLNPENIKTESEVMPVAPGFGQSRTIDMAPAAEPDIQSRATPDKRLAQKAGILCNDPLFWRFLNDSSIFWMFDVPISGSIQDVDDAAIWLRKFCRVASRADIIPDTIAADLFEIVTNKFIRWRDADKYVEAS